MATESRGLGAAVGLLGRSPLTPPARLARMASPARTQGDLEMLKLQIWAGQGLGYSSGRGPDWMEEDL